MGGIESVIKELGGQVDFDSVFDKLGIDAYDKKNFIKQANISLKNKYVDFKDEYDSYDDYVKGEYYLSKADTKNAQKLFDSEVLFLGYDIDEILSQGKLIKFDKEKLSGAIAKKLGAKSILSDYDEEINLGKTSIFKKDE